MQQPRNNLQHPASQQNNNQPQSPLKKRESKPEIEINSKQVPKKKDTNANIAIINTQMAFDPNTNQVICINTLANGQMVAALATPQQVAQYQQSQQQSQPASQRSSYAQQPQRNSGSINSDLPPRKTSERQTSSTNDASLQRKPTERKVVERTSSTPDSLQRKPTEYKATKSNEPVKSQEPKKSDKDDSGRPVDRMIQLANGDFISPLDGGYQKGSIVSKRKSSLDDILNLPD
eukprot:NODE_30_length_37342_cov_0.449507.p18 type:complete len:233 gc:universal NODE_30_length_37342_cov_0.449507:20952-21650(+)